MELAPVFTGGGITLAELVTIARAAETAGASGVYVTEAWRSGFVPLAAVACATSRLRLGPYVLNAYGRSPLLTGMSAIDLNELSGGRLVLGVGGGNRIINEQWQGIAHTRVLTKMSEYVTLLKQMARTRLGERIDYDGRVHSMHWASAVDPGATAFPVHLAAVFPDMLRVAARVADGIALGATLSAAYLRDTVRPLVAAAASAAGRDPSVLRWQAVHFVAVDDDRERARHAARAALGHLFAPLPHPYYAHTMREQGFADVVGLLLEAVERGTLESTLPAIPDELVDTLVIAGTPAECRARIAEYAGLVDELLLLNAMPAAPGRVVESYASLLGLIAAPAH